MVGGLSFRPPLPWRRRWTQLSHYKVTDDAQYLQDTTGSVDLVMLGFDWIF